ncbi:hypothetical protein PFICI_12162 [Pestalotiopsis fici W106-1]|uniref:Uncharacterized protein n=1 Tax=Pestalotiopsis fici (strain W106-1 / CGMCC3.15140) TaxID=1229662 RepID=W3WSE0_PESFW|nr:uncharacterized protein PFICI_12162 [Pestalotiopsis fici W106-1]ETS76775.1 hypothetical protein PFICI_12162 [Pestalotiopsis fici W106-1]
MEGRQEPKSQSEEPDYTRMILDDFTTGIQTQVARFDSQSQQKQKQPAHFNDAATPAKLDYTRVVIDERTPRILSTSAGCDSRLPKQKKQLDYPGTPASNSVGKFSPDHDLGNQLRSLLRHQSEPKSKHQDISHILTHSYGYPSDISVGCGGGSRDSLASSVSGGSDQHSDASSMDEYEYQQSANGQKRPTDDKRRVEAEPKTRSVDQ